MVEKKYFVLCRQTKWFLYDTQERPRPGLKSTWSTEATERKEEQRRLYVTTEVQSNLTDV